MVVFTFSLMQSNLPLRTAFPVLMGNIYQWLNPYRIQETATHIQPQDVIELGLHPHADRLVVEKPGGGSNLIRWQTAHFISPKRRSLVSITWSTTLAARRSTVKSSFVSLQEVAETNVGSQIPALAGSGASVPPVELPVFHEIWRYLALVVLFLLLFEWVWYHRVRT